MDTPKSDSKPMTWQRQGFIDRARRREAQVLGTLLQNPQGLQLYPLVKAMEGKGGFTNRRECSKAIEAAVEKGVVIKIGGPYKFVYKLAPAKPVLEVDGI